MDRDGRRRVGRVPNLLEGGRSLVKRVAVDHGDGPVHDVGQARPLALQDGRDVVERLLGLLPHRGADDLAVGIDAVLPADVDRLRRLFDHDGLAEGSAVRESFGVDVPDTHELASSAGFAVDTSYTGRPQRRDFGLAIARGRCLGAGAYTFGRGLALLANWNVVAG